jgi:hypothetical protein
MPHDLPLLLILIAVNLPISVVLGLLLRTRSPGLCRRYKAWTSSLPWWIYVAGGVFFLVIAGGQAAIQWWAFAGLFVVGAAMEFVTAIITWRGRKTGTP